VLCEAENIDKKVIDLKKLVSKTSNKKKKEKFWGDIESLLHAKGVLTGRHTEMRAGKKKTKDARDGLIAKVFLFFICSRLKLRFARRRISPRMIIQIWPLALPMHKRMSKS
jgi:hypothetical protein